MTFDPCGQIMGSLRSCYSTKAVFWRGGPLLPIVWYFAPHGAKTFKGNHVFGSSVWDSDKPFDPPVGEQGSAKRFYELGHLPGPVDGQRLCGVPADFEGDGSPGNALFVGGIRACCRVAPSHPLIGVCPGTLLGDVVHVDFTPDSVFGPPAMSVAGLSADLAWNGVEWVGSASTVDTTFNLTFTRFADLDAIPSDRPVVQFFEHVDSCSPFAMHRYGRFQEGTPPSGPQVYYRVDLTG